MILKTFDGSELFVTKEQAAKINEAIANGVKMVEINAPNGKVYLAAGAIAIIKSGGEPKPATIPPDRRLGMSAEERKRGREKMEAIRQQLIEKHVIKP